ncbi:MAG: diadenylate cyclase [Nitrospinota bacterium]
MESVIGVLWKVPWNHLIDICVMWFLGYQVYMRFRGTQAMRLLVRVLIVWLAYLTAQTAGLMLTSFLLWALWIAVLIFFLITFQGEIQRILMRINPMRPVGVLLRLARHVHLPDETLTAVSAAAFALASKRIGAIIIWERLDPIEPLLRSPGEIIDAEARPALLETLFITGTPYHDGALYIQEDKIYRAGCVLPLSENTELGAHYGTRHRAAVGLTERSDALALVVSEERGEVSAVEHGEITPLESVEALTAWLTSRLRGREDESQSAAHRLREIVEHNWRIKLAALAAVAVLWAVAIKQKESPQNIFATLGPGIERAYTVPVEYYNLPPGLSLGPDRMTRVRIRLKAEADLLNFIDSGRFRIKINLSGARDGPLDHVISTRDIDLPARIRLVGAEPSEIRLRLGKKTNTSASRP